MIACAGIILADATTFSIMTLSITTLSITTLSITTLSIMPLSIKGLFETLSINDAQHYSTHSISSAVMLSGVMLSIAMY